MASFHAALNAGVDMIELDVRMSKDFELVIMHDRTVDRTTNGTGHVWERTLDELKAFDAGAWFSTRFKGERVPALRDVMDILPGTVALNIEVKTDGDPRRHKAMEEACALLIRERRIHRQVMVSSFDHAFLQRLHAIDPSIPLGALLQPVWGLVVTPSRLARTTGASAFICSLGQVRKTMVKNAHAHGMRAGVYGVNTLTHLARARRFGVDVILSDFPERIIRGLK
jgi:glycerophosphoryl diester phosphodiesterase